uniref:ERCC1-like central domain-containing protein n=1 Tax=Pseudo-nitzschia australis TaxID=44445 RepID=A0A7S4AD78_9STRA
MPPKKVVCNPYAKKKSRVATTTITASASSSSSALAPSFPSGAGQPPTTTYRNRRTNPYLASSNNNNGNNVNGNNVNVNVNVNNDKSIDDALLPSNYTIQAMRPGTFSQAFGDAIDNTDNFRRASDSFENPNPTKKKETFRLAKPTKQQQKQQKKQKQKIAPGNKQKHGSNMNDINTNVNSNDSSSKKSAPSSSLSNRDGAAGTNSNANGNGDSEQGVNANSNAATENNGNTNANGSSDVNTASNDNNDVRIHHTMLQPHVLYVSTRQKGNSILPLIRNVPVAYSPMVPDYILGPTACALFLSIKYHKLYPRYIHRRTAELRDDFTLRVLLVLVDVDDNANSLLQLNTFGVQHRLTLVLCWSEHEAARYLETYKVRDGRDAGCIQKRQSTDPLEQVADVLCSTKHGRVNKTDALNLWTQFSTVAGIAGATQDELALVPGMGPLKVKRLHDALHKPFSSRRARAKQAKRRQQQEEDQQEQGSS